MRSIARFSRRPERFILLLLVLPLFFAACSSGDGDATPTATATLTDSGSIKDPPLTPLPTSAAPTATPAGGGSPVNSEPFVFQSTADGATINGHLYSAQGPKRKVVILVHGESEDQKAWQEIAQDFAQRGIAAVTFDLRGHGETPGSKDISKLPDDLDVAVRYLQSLDWPLIYIVGSEAGGAAALRVGAEQDLAGVATLSTRPNGSLNVTGDIPGVVEPKLFMAAAGDGTDASAVITMAGNASEPKMSRIIENTSARGIALLQADAARQVLFNFIGSQ